MKKEADLTHIPESKRKEIVAALEARGVRQPCPRCGNSSFTLLDGYFNLTIQPNFQGLVIGGPSVPVIATACNRCGFLSNHALGALGLLPAQAAKENKGED